MSIISISNLNVTGSDLFMDSEGYLQDLSWENDFNILGGLNAIPTLLIIYSEHYKEVFSIIDHNLA